MFKQRKQWASADHAKKLTGVSAAILAKCNLNWLLYLLIISNEYYITGLGY